MKDILTCAAPILMAKVGALKKSEKNITKKQINLKSFPKIGNIGKIKRTPTKKRNEKKKDSAKKKSHKKTSKKSDSKRKCNKESKNDDIPSKKCADRGKKQKHSQKNHVTKIKDHVTSIKIQKILSEHCDAEKLCNGNPSSSLTQTGRNPWILKLDIPPQPNKPILNGVSSNGTLPISNKSVIFIPKHNAVSGVILKRGTSLPLIEHKGNIPEKKLHRPKLQNSNTFAISSKEVLKNGFDFNNSSNNFNIKKKAEMNKSKSNNITSKKIKTCVPNEHKVPFSKTTSHNIIDQKAKAKDFPRNGNQRQRNRTAASKSISMNHENEKSFVYKQVCLNSKSSNQQVSKYQKTNKISKPSGNYLKKTNQSTDNKALCLRNQTKVHPQRMASLDAMAKMHVICSTDRRIPTEVSKICKQNVHTSQVRMNTKKIHLGIKKKIQEIKGRVIKSQVNCVKFEESSISEGTKNVRTFCSFSQEQEHTISKKPRGRPRLKPTIEIAEEQQSLKLNNGKQKISKKPKPKNITKVPKTTRGRKTISSKQNNKSPKKCDSKGKKRTKKTVVENKKVKVKETIRMQKTCTFQSVTTVSSHKAVNSVVSSCSRLGVTTNFETKKTIVRDDAFEKKSNLRLEELQSPLMPSLEEPVVHVSNCCGHIQSSLHNVIPLAHSRSCHKCHGSEKPATTHPFCCNKGLPIHQCSQKERVIYHHLPHDCGCNFDTRDCCRSVTHGCCCSSSLLQAIHEPCSLTKESNLYGHNSCCHLNSMKCSCCHNNLSTEQQGFNLTPSNLQSRCVCHEQCHSSKPIFQQMSCSCSNVMRQYAPAPLVPFDQTPLDLSVGSSNTQSTEKSSGQSKSLCQTYCCQDNMHFQPCSQNYQYNPHCSYIPSNCSSCYSKNICREKESLFNTHSVADERFTPDTMPILASMSYSNDEASSDLICQEISTIHNYTFSSAKQEINNSIRLPIHKKRKFSHGWSWEGEPSEQMIALTNDSIPSPKRCYPALRHREGDVINERDCVLLKSGPKDTDLPYVAKIAAFWENPDDGEMMMSLLWYYRPEHTEQGRSGQMDDEVFASKHRDINSVACIEDKCFVLTFNEYSRYRTNLAMNSANATSKTMLAVPQYSSTYLRQHRLPTENVSPDMIFFCRHVYDFRQKRILKNPT